MTFPVKSMLALGLVAWILVMVPDSPAPGRGGRIPPLRTLTVLVAVATAILALLADNSVLVYVTVPLWGLGRGGVPT